jgi:hypothetical protein
MNSSMLGSLLDDADNLVFLFQNPAWLLMFVFQVWMFVDAIRREEWIWAVFIFIGFGLSALLYYFMVYRTSSAWATSGFQLPGAYDRRRIKELQAQIHHLDKAHHHSQLGDIQFRRAKLKQAEASYRAALERDGADLETRSHLGQCLARQRRYPEALPLLEGVCAEQPDHEYGYTRMALAETCTALGDKGKARRHWEAVMENHSYARAKLQLAQLQFEQNELDAARTAVQEVLDDDAHAPAYQRKRDRVWVRRARALRRKLR